MLARRSLAAMQVAAAEDVERQIAVRVVVAVEETAFLVTVQGIIGGVEIEDDAAQGLGVRIEEQVDEQRLDRLVVVADPVVAADAASQRLLKPVERRLSGNRRAALAARLELARQHGHHGIMAQMIVVVEVLVAERKAEQTLADERLQAMLDQLGRTRVDEAARKPRHEADRLVCLPEQQRTRIRGHRPAIEASHNLAALHGSEIQRILATLCRHRGSSPSHEGRCCTTTFAESEPRCPYRV